MSTITCKQCGLEIEVSAALEGQMKGQIEQQVLAAAHAQHAAEIAKIKAEAEESAKAERMATQELARKKLAGERELLAEQAKAELDLAKQKLEMQLANEQKKQASKQELLIKSLREDADNEKQNSKELREQLGELMQSLRDEKKARENAELDARKKLAAEESKIRADIEKAADERQRLNLAAKEKTITDLQKALDDAQRKAAQGSQQMQGEVMELDLEQSLAQAFRDDLIDPVAKGVNGADIRQVVRSSRGTDCGVILWEIKRTKNWTDSWIPKLKQDMLNEKANIPIIVTQTMPKTIDEDIGQLHGVWICKPALAIILASLLRKSLLDAGLQKALAQNRGEKADTLYNFVTSHEFAHQIESMVETYTEMAAQVTKERAAYERIWSQRQKQIERLLLGTANIYGSMQGHIGQSSMPKIKGLDLLEAGEADELSEAGNDRADNLTLI